MDLCTQLLDRHDLNFSHSIANYIGDSKDRFKNLWDCFKNSDPTIQQRASWIIEITTGLHPQLLEPYLLEMIHIFSQEGFHNSIYRNFGKILCRHEIPEDEQGFLYDKCIEYLLNPKKEIAIKAHCMQLAFNIGKPYPELIDELSIVIHELIKNGSPGIISRGKKILQQIKRNK